MNDNGEYEPFDPFGDEQDNELWQSVQQQMDEQQEQPYAAYTPEAPTAAHYSRNTGVAGNSSMYINGAAGPLHHPAYATAPEMDNSYTNHNDSWNPVQQDYEHHYEQQQHYDQHPPGASTSDNAFVSHNDTPTSHYASAPPPPPVMEERQQQFDEPMQQPLQSPDVLGGSATNAVSLTSTPLSSDSSGAHPPSSSHATAAAAPSKSQVVELLLSSDEEDENDDPAVAKRPRREEPQPPISLPPSGAAASYQARMAALVNKVGGSAAAALRQAEHIINPGSTLNGFNLNHPYLPAAQPYSAYDNKFTSMPYATHKPMDHATIGMELDNPTYLDLPPDFVPTWNSLIPPALVKPPKRSTKKAYELSLISLSEFTITGLPLYHQGPPTPISGLRPIIKRISREHGNAVFEKDTRGEGVGGRWKIPIGAYHAFVAYLKSDPDCVDVKTIPQLQLKIASLGRARLEKDYPTAESLLIRGVPFALASTLAPFQRGGVEFVLEREGRALIADEMGLGKTIQSIASMAVYHKEWPLLVLTPSGARYHWESEFRSWLGVSGAAASKKLEEFSNFDEDSKPLSDEAASASGHDFPLLEDSQIHVLSSSKGPIIPNRNTRIVICSYGLAPMLAKDDAIRPGMFKCAIADESHMMKNSKSKRTQFLLPILKACNRCLLLSGTPALSRAGELWPQLQILASDKHPGFWDDENDFMDKYVKNGNAARRAELHTMLTGTLMIRRLKDDILKDMPRKAREKAIVAIPSREMKIRMKECMELLRQGKGVMAKLARQHSAIADATNEEDGDAHGPGSVVASAPEASAATPSPEQDNDSVHQLLTGQRPGKVGTDEEALLDQVTMTEYRDRVEGVYHAIEVAGHRQPYTAEAKAFLEQQQDAIYNELKVRFRERLQAIRGARESRGAEDETPARAAVLNQMYRLTGESKIPAVVKFLSRWLGDPAKGKICVFAHHIFMLDAIARDVRLSNSGGPGTYKYIRIDGKTSPKNRQEQIDTFQNDPSVRVALLGITAAGVAVTLTAASQVLFAELFWTPAIMIQAEDRCHRIGQRARVHCKYMVASGTLDDILWKLIEKKFRELGEFVEGKEKLKMIVHKVYKNEAELHSIFDVDEDELDDDDLQPDPVESSGDDVLPLDSSLEHDIEEFGREEQAMLLAAEGDDEGEESEQISATRIETTQPQTGPGRSEEDAIALSDDDDENVEVVAQQGKAVDLENHGSDLNTSGTLPGCRIYKVILQGPTLGVEVCICKGRIVVSNKLAARKRRLGNDCKPDVGDVLVAVDHQVMPHVYKLDRTLQYLKAVLGRPQPSVMFFAEDNDFKQFYKNNFGEGKKERKTLTSPDDQVVDLILDE